MEQTGRRGSPREMELFQSTAACLFSTTTARHRRTEWHLPRPHYGPLREQQQQHPQQYQLPPRHGGRRQSRPKTRRLPPPRHAHAQLRRQHRRDDGAHRVSSPESVTLSRVFRYDVEPAIGAWIRIGIRCGHTLAFPTVVKLVPGAGISIEAFLC